MSDLVAQHLESIRHRVEDDTVPPHYPTCLGCGPDAEHGFHLQGRRDGDAVVVEHVFTTAQSGGPGIAHGGAVATVVDDTLGFLLYVVRKAGVTRKLEVEYLKPVLVGPTYTVRATVDSVDGRKVWLSCTGTAPDGVLAFRGSALFLEVPLSHFATAVAGTGADPAGNGQAPVNP